MSALRRTPGNRSGPGARAKQRAAFYDLDGTLLRGTVLAVYAFYAGRAPGWLERLRRLALLGAMLPAYAVADWMDRATFNRLHYRAYRGLSRDRLEVLAEELYAHVLRGRLKHGAAELIEANRAAGYEPVLVTGALDVAVAPLARALGIETVGANRLVFRAGLATGELRRPVLAGPAKAAWVREVAAERGFDLEASIAYADDAADLPLLAMVGRPVVVNPDRRLAAAARAHGWARLDLG